MTARKANPKPKVGIVINPSKARLTVQASRPATPPPEPCQISRAVPAKASTCNLFERATYTPTRSAYQRNSGHPHITSHGVRC